MIVWKVTIQSNSNKNMESRFGGGIRIATVRLLGGLIVILNRPHEKVTCEWP